MKSWYEENIEEGVREVVKLLRDNGFNTTCSCHHSMEIQLVAFADGEMLRLHNLLYEAGFRDYSIQWCMNVTGGNRINEWISIHIGRDSPADREITLKNRKRTKVKTRRK